jgi:flagellar biosynthesis protein FlhF
MRRLRDRDVILVDTPGRGPARLGDLADVRRVLAPLKPAEVHLVLPAGLQPRLARRLAASHRALGLTHLVATKLDECPDDTVVFDLAAELGLPMRWCTDGQEVPADLRPASTYAPGAFATSTVAS